MKKKNQIKVPTARQLPSGKWFVQLRLDGKSISITEPTERAAVTKAMAIKQGLLKSKPSSRSAMTLAQAMAEYIAQRENTHTEECTAYLHYAMSVFAKIAELMGEEDKKETYQRYAAGAKEAYNHLFVRTGTLDTDRQAKLVRPLALGLLEDADKLYAQNRLNQAVENRNYHVATGFLSTAFLLPMLTEAGFAETAYKMLENTEKPGWLGEILDGATTIWENWDGTASRNHYSPGAVCMCLFEYAAGIRPSGERHFVISPVPGGTLCHAEGSYNSLYGKIVSRWEKSDEGITYTVTVPANCTAELVLPNGEHRSLTAGSHTIHA